MIESALIESNATIVCDVHTSTIIIEYISFRSDFDSYTSLALGEKKNCDFIMMHDILLLFVFFFVSIKEIQYRSR